MSIVTLISSDKFLYVLLFNCLLKDRIYETPSFSLLLFFILKIGSIGLRSKHLSGATYDPPLQVKCFSTKHLSEHPSPLIVFPSSHSALKRIPSPHISTHFPFYKV